MERRAGPNAALHAGIKYLESGDYNTADHAFKVAEDLYRGRFGRNHNYVQQAVAYRAWTRMKMGLLEDASALFEEAVAIERDTNGDNTPRGAQLKDQWADVVEALGRADDAETLRRKARLADGGSTM
jgi:tetratricopeptide (TPR) repeat protein